MTEFGRDLNLTTQDDVLHQGGISDCFIRKVAPLKIPHWQEHIEYILHLTHFSHYLMCVTGPQGVGKSTFIQSLIEQLGTDVEYRVIDANHIDHPTELLLDIAASFGIEFSAATQSYNQKIDFLNKELSRFRKHTLLVVDNAENWSVDVLDALLDVITSSPQQPQLHCLICADDEIEDKFSDEKLKNRMVSHSHLMHLKPLSVNESKELLSVYMEQAGYALSAHIGDDAVLQITEKSGGIPFVLKQLAIDYLRDAQLDDGYREEFDEDLLDDEPRRVSSVKRSWRSMPVHWALGGAVVALIAGLITFQEDINKHLNPTVTAPVAKNSERAVLLAPKAIASTKSSDIKSALTKAIEEPKTVLKAKQKPIIESHDIELAKQKIEIEPAKPMPEKIQAPQITSVDISKPIVKAKAPVLEVPVAKAKPVVKPKKVQAITQSRASVYLSRMDKKVLAMNGRHFALQLFGVHDRQKLEAFVRQQKNRQHFYYAQTKYRGKDWFVLLYGDFKKRDEAVNAIKKLPKNLQKMQPWPRKLADVQSSIKKR